MRPEVLGVIGLGAIGGSVAWRAVLAGVGRVIGYSPEPAHGAAAMKAGAVTEVATSGHQVVRQADFLVIAAPPAVTLAQLARHAGDITARGLLTTDVSSVKSPVVGLAGRLGLGRWFAGSHPLAGSHRSGFPAARADLLDGALVYVTPVPGEGGTDAAREVGDFWAGVCGGECVTLAASEHDALVAWTSHLPQVAASALARALARSGPAGVTYGAGARDTTRLAASSTDMWRDILLLNREAVLGTLEGLEEEVGALRHALATADAAALAAWLDQGARWRRDLGP